MPQDHAARLGIAVIGAGQAALPHAKSLLDLAERVEVVGVAARNAQRLADFAATFPFPVTTDIDALIAAPEVEAVLILTPPNAHLDLARRCFAAGKHVLVEKPLSTTLADAEELVRLGRVHQRRLGVVLQHRFRPGAQRLAELVRARRLGEIVFSSVSVPWWRPQSYYDIPGHGSFAYHGGGVLLTQAIHAIDLYRSMVGIAEIHAADVGTTALHRMEAEDYVAALIRTGNGAPGLIRATTAAYPGFPETIEIAGTLGSARLTGGNLDVQWLSGENETVTATGATGGGANIMDFPHDWHRDLIADFIDAIQTDRDPVVSGEEALATQRILMTIQNWPARGSA